MTNTPTVAAAGGALAALGNLKAGLANVKQAVRAPGGEPIMRLGRDGVWIYGADNVEVEDGSEWAINPLSIRFGYVCWKVIPQGSKAQPELFGKHSRTMMQTPLDVMALQAKDSEGNDVDHEKHPWAEFIGCDMLCVSGEDSGTQSPYEPSSTGGIRAMRELCAKIDAQLDSDPAHPVPVVELASDSYEHKQYGKTYFPVLKVKRWVGLDDVNDVGAAPGSTEQGTGQTTQAEPEVTKVADAPKEAPAATTSQTQAATTAQPATGERRRRRAA